VVRNTLDLTGANTTPAALPVGVVRNTMDLTGSNTTPAAQPLGVVRNTLDLTGSNTTPASEPLGVVRSTTEWDQTNVDSASAAVGIVLEPVVTQVLPKQFSRSSSNTLTLSGSSLQTVTEVSFVSNQGITQTSPFVVNPDGTSLSIFIDIASDAGLGLRQLILGTATGTLLFSVPNDSLLEITP
jgi:hypothetical protein